MKALVRRLRRSLAAPLILLVAAFIAVPILFYLTFQQADQERQEMLLGSIQAQGRLVAAGLEPQLERASPDTFTDAAETLSHFSDGNARIWLLFRPGRPQAQAASIWWGRRPRSLPAASIASASSSSVRVSSMTWPNPARAIHIWAPSLYIH